MTQEKNTLQGMKLMTAIETSVILADKTFRVSGRKLKKLQKQAEQAK
jgi:hypothetical protein